MHRVGCCHGWWRSVAAAACSQTHQAWHQSHPSTFSTAPRSPRLGGREGPGIDSRKFHSQVHSLTCSEPAPVTTRTLVLLFASSSLHHHFTLLVFWLLKKSILPPSCSRAESEWVSACRWRWQCARHLASSPPSRHCSRLLVVHH